MQVIKENLIPIKETQSIRMYYSPESGEIRLQVEDKLKTDYAFSTINIPMSKAFQVKRGLESVVQRYYRRKVIKK